MRDEGLTRLNLASYPYQKRSQSSKKLTLWNSVSGINTSFTISTQNAETLFIVENSEMFPPASIPPAPAFSTSERLNPFANDVCAGPFGVEENRSVPGLNADILGQLTATIDERQSNVGHVGGQPLLLLTAPRAGYGKTHLLGRLAAAASGQVVLVPLAFRLEDQIGLSAVAVRGLESMARAETPREGWTKLREACAGVCASLVRRLIESGALPCANPEQALRVLSGDPVDVFDERGGARLIGDWVRRYEAQLRKPMIEQAMKRVPVIPAALESWVHAMLNHALDGGMSKMAVLRMLAADESNEGPVTLLRLLGLWRPVVLLVDHLDAYYRNPEAGLRIASLLLDMSEMDGVHVVLSLNQDVWQATFGHHLPSAMEDRLTTSQMLLRGIGEKEAATMLRMRLDHAGVKVDELREFESFVDVKRYFLGRPLGSVSARTFLRHAAKQWEFFQQTLASPQPVAPVMPVNAEMEEPGTLPLLTETLLEEDAPKDVSIFDAQTTSEMKLMAEGLAEPQPALPQQFEKLLQGANGTHFSPPNLLPEELEAEIAIKEAESASMSQFSPSSAGAFENLREMLGKLRQAAPAAPEPAVHTVVSHLAGVISAAAPVAAAVSTIEAPQATQDAERDALLGRYEALRLQMMAEAATLPLDYSRLADLIRLAGRRFPLVRFNEHELPGMTGRYAMCWSLQGMEIIFGLANFADGPYWRTLAGFAAGRMVELQTNAVDTAPKLKIATFKSDREQQSWAILQHGTVFPEVLRPNVDAIHLDPSGVAALYAMQRIIKESETGLLQATPRR
jgi:hypothetical protein